MTITSRKRLSSVLVFTLTFLLVFSPIFQAMALPQDPLEGQEEAGGPGEPTSPGDPDEPGTVDPEDPDADEPDEPGTEDPGDPDADEPDEPRTEDPGDPDADEPGEPGTEDPADPEQGTEPGEPDQEPADPADPGNLPPGEEDEQEPADPGTIPEEPGDEEPPLDPSLPPGEEDPQEPPGELPPVIVADPAVAVAISADEEEYAPGETVSFSIRVTNTGNVNLPELLVEDSLTGLRESISLAAEEAQTVFRSYTIPLDYDRSQLTNSVTVRGYFAQGEEEPILVADGDSITVNILLPPPVQPALTAVIQTDKDEYQPGETVHFTFQVTNSGQVELADLLVQDTLTGFAETIPHLAPGEAWTGSSSFVIPEDFAKAKLTNSLYVQGLYEGQEVSAQDTVLVELLIAPTVPASLAVDIQTDKLRYRAGDTVRLTITLSNRGSGDLSDIRLWVPLADLNERVPFLASGQKAVLEGEFHIPYNFYMGYIGVGAYAEGDWMGSAVSGQGKALVVVDEEVSSSFFKEVELPSLPDNWESLVPFDYIPDPGDEPEGAWDGLVQKVKGLLGMGEGILLSGSDGNIAVSKSAQRTTGCRSYEVTLDITGTPPSADVDLILVIDCSNSMNDGSPSILYHAKEAAKGLAAKVLANPNNRVAVVSFAYEPGFLGLNRGNLDRDTKIERSFTNNLQQVNNAINGLKTYGGTNTQAGFRRAKNLMQSSGRSGVSKVIVLLTDGVPTVSIGRSYGPSEPTSHNSHTRAAYEEGQSCHQLGYQVFTVAMLGEVPTKCLTVARETMQWAQNAGYYETFQAADLTGIYNQISQQLDYSATNAEVTDIIPENFELDEDSLYTQQGTVSYNKVTRTITWYIGNIETEATLKYKIKAHPDYQGGSQVPTNVSATLSYEDVYGQSQTLSFPVPKVDVPAPLTADAGEDRQVAWGSSVTLGGDPTASGGTGPYTYEWTCSNSDWTSNEANPVVTVTEDTTYTVKVTDVYGCSKTDSVTITVVKGSLKVTKKVTNGDSGRKFPIYVEGNGHTWSMLLGHNESATITGLEPGTYTVWEVVPMNYECSNSRFTVTVTNEEGIKEVVVTNQKDDKPWFWDEDEETNTFKVGFWPGPEGGSPQSAGEEGFFPASTEAVLGPEKDDVLTGEGEEPEEM
ncbi:MAG: DUF7507 domain-containing protein [Bacillota bacterium]